MNEETTVKNIIETFKEESLTRMFYEKYWSEKVEKSEHVEVSIGFSDSLIINFYQEGLIVVIVDDPGINYLSVIQSRSNLQRKKDLYTFSDGECWRKLCSGK